MSRMSIAAFCWLFTTTAIVTLVAGYSPRILAWPLGLWIDLTVAHWILGPIYRYIWPALRSKIKGACELRIDSRHARTSERCSQVEESKSSHEEESTTVRVTNDDGAILQAECRT
ncbi:hypothetical protein BST61_g5625 [Cercospora zeina]